MHMVTVTTLMPLVDQELLVPSGTPEFTPGLTYTWIWQDNAHGYSNNTNTTSGSGTAFPFRNT